MQSCQSMGIRAPAGTRDELMNRSIRFKNFRSSFSPAVLHGVEMGVKDVMPVMVPATAAFSESRAIQTEERRSGYTSRLIGSNRVQNGVSKRFTIRTCR